MAADFEPRYAAEVDGRDGVMCGLGYAIWEVGQRVEVDSRFVIPEVAE